MKKVNIKIKDEEFTDEKGSDSKILYLKIKNNHNEVEEEKNTKIWCDKLFIIRFMLLMVFFIFCYYFFKLIQKSKRYNKIKYYLYNQKDLTPSKLEQLKSHQLINENNIKIIKEIKISLTIEYSKYIHLKMKDSNKERWEIPEDILNNEYLKNLSDNIKNETYNFKIEYLVSNDDFYFYLYSDSNEKDNKRNIFYSFNTSKNFIYSDNYINFESYLTSDDIYGFGERIHNFKLNEGIYTIWPTDRKNYYDEGKGGQNLYGHQPIGLHKTKYKDIWLGFVFLNTNAQDIQIKNKGKDNVVLTHKTIGGIIDYYLIVDNSPENVLRDIHYLIGKPILPPFWSLGYHQCRWGFHNFSEFKNVYETYKLKKIPIDAMWIDIDAMNNYLIFTLDKNKFKELPDYIDNVIHKDNGYFVPIIDIGLGYDKEDISKYIKIGNDNNLFIKSGYTKKNLMAKVWFGKTLFPDFFNPNIYKLWNAGLDDYYNEIKYDGIWLDMNEPSNLKTKGIYIGEIFEDEKEEEKCNMIEDLKISYFPGYTNDTNKLIRGSISMNGITYNNNILYNNKPLISVYQTKLTYNYLKNKNKRPFILTRSNSIGIGKYSFHWLGDNFSKNEYIKYSIAGIFNYNIFGIPFTGADICGFNYNAKGNLCARWYNIGAFYPFSRNHNSRKYKDQYPWTFGKYAEDIIRKDIQYRYSLLIYFYSQLFLVSLNEKGSFFKPVMFEYPNDKYSYEDIESKIMLGDALLCAFFDNNEKDKEFALPNSHFNLYPSGENILNYSADDNNNLRKKTLSGKISDLHIFLRGGYIIPMQDTFDKYILNTYFLRKENLNLIINPDEKGNSKGVLFFDNDDIDVIKNRNYIRIELEFKNRILKINTSNENNIDYEYNNIKVNKIEIWRINELLNEDEIKKDSIDIKIKSKNEEKAVKGKINKSINKIIININNIILFDLYELNLANN